MKLWCVAVGQKMPDWVDAAYVEYARRMPRELPLQLLEIKPERRDKGKSAEVVMQLEAARISERLPAGCRRVVLDERGRLLTSRELAGLLDRWQQSGEEVAFVIGGADGLDPALKRSADLLWSLSPLTLPHGMVRVILAEQLYRAQSILHNHPYHRE